jgi:putative addiction module component (TIGR02574 family)
MTTAEKIYRDALALPAETRVALTERLVASLADDVPAEIQRAHIDEVRKRIAQVESGEVKLIPGDEALARVRNVLTKHSATAK